MSRVRAFVDDSWGSSASGNVLFAEDSTSSVSNKSYGHSSTAREVVKQVADHSSWNVATSKKPLKCYDGDSIFESKSATSQTKSTEINYTLVRLSKSSKRILAMKASCAEEQCMVCHQYEANCKTVTCGHVFHVNCVMRWFRAKQSCPVCRAPAEDLDALSEAQKKQGDKEEKQELPPESDSLGGSTVSEFSSGSPESQVDFSLSVDLLDIPLEMRISLVHEPTGATNNSKDDENMVAEGEDAKKTDLQQEETSPTENEEVNAQEKVTPASPPDAFLPSEGMFLPVPLVYQPQSTFPDYWKVLHEGMGNLSMQCLHGNPLSLPLKRERRRGMVPIAPKPAEDAEEHAGDKRKPENSLSSHRSKLVRTSMVSCKCMGGCRNGRCVCVKEGGLCSSSCSCVDCKNPWEILVSLGLDTRGLHEDPCLMQNLSKLKNIPAFLQREVTFECCGGEKKSLSVYQVYRGYTCPDCSLSFSFSWCQARLCEEKKMPRNHCQKCKKCVDYRNIHCDKCNKCFFAGEEATSLSSSASSASLSSCSSLSSTSSSSSPLLRCPCHDAGKPTRQREEERKEGEGEESEGCTIM